MAVGRLRLVLESAVAGLLALAPFAFRSAFYWPSMQDHSPSLLTRLLYVLGGVLFPGTYVGMVVGAALDITGFTTDWDYLRKVETVISGVVNCLLFASAWAILRGLPTNSIWRRVTIAVAILWVLGAIPFYVFGMWMAVG